MYTWYIRYRMYQVYTLLGSPWPDRGKYATDAHYVSRRRSADRRPSCQPILLSALADNGWHEPGDPCAGGSRSMRYSELSRKLAGVSQKMLTQTLRNLERDGLLTRTVTPTVPVTVAYELTELGLSLQQMIRGLKRWAEVHMDDVVANRESYDAAS